MDIEANKRTVRQSLEAVDNLEWRLHELYLLRGETQSKIDELVNTISHHKQNAVDVYKRAWNELLAENE